MTHILVIEDDQNAGKAMVQLLERQGHQVTLKRDGEALPVTILGSADKVCLTIGSKNTSTNGNGKKHKSSSP